MDIYVARFCGLKYGRGTSRHAEAFSTRTQAEKYIEYLITNDILHNQFSPNRLEQQRDSYEIDRIALNLTVQIGNAEFSVLSRFSKNVSNKKINPAVKLNNISNIVRESRSYRAIMGRDCSIKSKLIQARKLREIDAELKTKHGLT
jgi:hypothetical protein